MNVERLLGWLNGFCESDTNNEEQGQRPHPEKPQGCGTQIRPPGLSLRHPTIELRICSNSLRLSRDLGPRWYCRYRPISLVSRRTPSAKDEYKCCDANDY